MSPKKKQVTFLFFLISLLFLVNYSYLDKALQNFLVVEKYANVTRVIDGDTIVVDGNLTVRLLGINSPEKGEFYYNDSKHFLENSILGKEIRLEFGKDKYDLYGRMLAYIYYNSENVNILSVKNGFSDYYFPSGKDKYYLNFEKAWEYCMNIQVNLCEISEEKCQPCIVLETINSEEGFVLLYNQCSFDCDLTGWSIKDEGRKKFIFEEFFLKSNSEVEITDKDFDEEYVWTKTGDTFFLRDKNGKLVLWKNY